MMKQTKLTSFTKEKYEGRATIDRLLTHPRTKQYRFDPTTKSFTDGKRRWGGSLKRLCRKFYPNYEESDKKRCGGSSKELGKKVHRHLQHQVNCSKESCSCDKKTRGFNKRAKALLKTLEEQVQISPKFVPTVFFAKKTGGH